MKMDLTFIQVYQVEKVVFIENRVCNEIFEVCSRVNLHHQYIFIMLALKYNLLEGIPILEIFKNV